MPVVDEPVTVVVSVNGWVRSRQGHGHDPAGFNFKTGDALYATYECRTTDQLVALTNTGRSYSVSVAGLPGARGDGAPMTTMVELEPGSRLVHFLAGPAETDVVLATQAGQGFVSKLAGLQARNRAGKQFMTLDAGDQPVVLRSLQPGSGALAVLTTTGRLLVFGLDEIKVLATGGRGVSLVTLEGPKDGLLDVSPVSESGLVIAGEGRAGKWTELAMNRKDLLVHVGKRARKGRALEAKLKAKQLRPA
jgi:topoisomerase-4 subunit A